VLDAHVLYGILGVAQRFAGFSLRLVHQPLSAPAAGRDGRDVIIVGLFGDQRLRRQDQRGD
jgi:hypothetical protein